MLWRVGFLLSSLIFGVAGIVVLLADIPFFIDLAVILFFGAAIFLLAATVLLSSKYTRIDD